MNEEEQWKHWNQNDINEEIAKTFVQIFDVIKTQQELINMIAAVSYTHLTLPTIYSV